MRDLLITIVLFSVVPFILFRPYLGVIWSAVVGYMNPHRLAWGFANTIPFAQVIAIATLVGLVFTRDRQTPPANLVTFLWFLFVAYTTLGTVFSLYPDLAWPYWLEVSKIQALAVLSLFLITDRRKLQMLIWAVVLSLGFYGVKGGFFVIRTGGEVGLVRGPPFSFVGSNNEIGLALLMVIPLMRFLQMQTQDRRISVLLTIVMLLSGVAVLGTFSRGAFVAGAFMLLFLWAKGRRKLMFALLAIPALLTAVLFMPQSWFGRMESITAYEEDASAQGRFDAWYTATGMANDHWFGGGFDSWTQENFDRYADGAEARAVHSIYFQVAGEHGWGALVVWLLLWAATWTLAGKLVRQARDDPALGYYADLMRMTQVSMVAYATGGAFLGLAYWDLPYHLIAFTVLADLQVRKDIASRLGVSKVRLT
jgi:probable O-glycosylation ligase (exosortase A-associated)